MFKISEGFGFGMGMMDMCGAVTGMMMVIGMDNKHRKSLKMENLLKQIPIRKQRNLQKNSVKRTEPIIVVT